MAQRPADPNPDDQFVALLDQKGIPALENVPSLIATAHRDCRQLDGGMPVDGVVNDMRERAFNANGGAANTRPTASTAPLPDSSLPQSRPTVRTTTEDRVPAIHGEFPAGR
jgi:hypothetical protein